MQITRLMLLDKERKKVRKTLINKNKYSSCQRFFVN